MGGTVVGVGGDVANGHNGAAAGGLLKRSFIINDPSEPPERATEESDEVPKAFSEARAEILIYC